jgi:hypothetical protein
MAENYRKPIRVDGPRMFGGKLCKWETMAERQAGPSRDPRGFDVAETVDTLTRTTEGKKISWHVGYKRLPDGLCSGGGMIFTTKREAIKVWESR